jgi:hypothetical protein
MVPINSGILQSGKQTIAVKILPLSGQPTVTEHADFNYDIKLFDVNNGFEFKEQLRFHALARMVNVSGITRTRSLCFSFNLFTKRVNGMCLIIR